MCLEAIKTEARTTSVGSKLARGIVLGGLAGGTCGLIIEMAPEKYGLKKKTADLYHDAKGLFESTFAGRSVMPLTPPVAVPSIDRELRRKEEPVSRPPPPEKVEAVVPRSQADEEPNDNEPLNAEPDISPAVEEEVEVVPVIEEVPEESVPAGDEAEIEPENQPPIQVVSGAEHEATISALQQEVSSLREELSRLKEEHNQDMAKAAGATQAALDTLDRLFNERESAISVAKHGLLVNELLYSLATDKSGTSAGALRVDLERRMDDLILDCFSGRDSTFFKILLSRVLAWLYAPSAAGVVTRVSLPGSATWENLCTLQVARQAVARGDLSVAVTHLEMLEHSESAQQWITRTKQAQQLWQGADAAVASMHDDLSRVVSSS